MKKKSNQILLSVIIVSYNTSRLTAEAVKSVIANIEESTLLNKTSEIIVVDNNSTDDTIFVLRNIKSRVPVRIISNTKNTGFATANNQGIQVAAGKYVLLLNSDTFVQTGALTALINSFLEQDAEPNASRCGIIAATLINPDGTIQPQGGDFPSLWTLFFQMSMLDDMPLLGAFLPSIQHTGIRTSKTISPTSTSQMIMPQDWVGATAMMIDTEVFASTSGLDEAIFMYAEDIEFCMRANHHGWSAAVHPSARVTHFGQQSSSKTSAIKGEFRGLLYIWSKHLPLWQTSIAKTMLQLGALLRIIIFGTIKKDALKARAYKEILTELLEE